MNGRIEQFAASLPGELDGALICSDVSRAYLTGMRSSAGTLLVLRDEAYFIIDFRYIEKARKTVKGCQVLLQEKLYDQLNEILRRHNVRRLGTESAYMTLEEYLTFQERLKAELTMDKAVSRVLTDLRMCKSPEELDCIRAAQKITDDAFAHILDYIRPGLPERDVARELRDFADRRGSEGPSFDYIVVSGTNSSMPHGVPSEKPLEAGDFVTMDFGCVIGGYCSDMTRTVAIGHCGDEMRQVYETVLRAQKAAIRLTAPGVCCKAVDAAARDLINGAYEGCFGHGTGHAVGLEIHEQPAFNTRDETICRPGMVMTVEPGIYLEGRFGVRIEDMVLVTKNGCEDLTNSPKELIVL